MSTCCSRTATCITFKRYNCLGVLRNICVHNEEDRLNLLHMAAQHAQEIRDVAAWREHVEMEIRILCILLDVAKFKRKE